MKQVETLLNIARSKLGVKENPKNSNNVEFNTWYYGKAVSGSAYAWCSAFVLWVIFAAGLLETLTGYTLNAARRAVMEGARNWKTLALKLGQWVTSGYRAGDVVVFDFDGNGTIDHVGIVESVDGAKIICIEGNTAVGNDSNGGEVMRCTRSASQIAGAFRPKYEEMEVDEMTEEERYDEYKKFRERYDAEIAQKPAHDWAKDVWVRACAYDIANGQKLFDGTNPQGDASREQLAALFERLGLLK